MARIRGGCNFSEADPFSSERDSDAATPRLERPKTLSAQLLESTTV